MAFVYILQAEGTTRVKIGRAKSVQKRKATLHTGSPFPLQVLASIETSDAVTLELALHKRYRVYRRHGEWFDIPADILRAFLRSDYGIGLDSPLGQAPPLLNENSTSRIKQKIMEGLAIGDIAKEFGVTRSYVYRLNRRMWMPGRNKQQYMREESEQTKCIKAMLTEGRNPRVIAKELGLTRSYVYRLKRSLGI